jgi:hypothetical protein
MTTLNAAAPTVKPASSPPPPVAAVDSPDHQAWLALLDTPDPDTWEYWDAWTWESGPDPTEDDHAWWARQDTEGGTVDGEGDPFDVNIHTVSATERRLDELAAEAGTMESIESGLALW